MAALNVFSSESGMGNGTEVASYVVFFAAIWAIWASQTVFDVSFAVGQPGSPTEHLAARTEVLCNPLGPLWY